MFVLCPSVIGLHRKLHLHIITCELALLHVVRIAILPLAIFRAASRKTLGDSTPQPVVHLRVGVNSENADDLTIHLNSPRFSELRRTHRELNVLSIANHFGGLRDR